MGFLKVMKKIRKQVGKILHTNKKVLAERSRASALDYKYHDDPEDLITLLLTSNKNRKSSDPESSSTGRIARKTNSDPETSSTGRSSRKTSVGRNSTRDPSTTFMCDMCVKPTDLKNSFYVEGCNHFYCQQCIVDFVRSKLDNNVAVIACPEEAAGCRGSLEPEYCRPILPESVFNRWITALHDHNGQPSDADNETYYNSNSGDYFTCSLCDEQVHLKNSFDVKGCHHFYCQPCVVNFVVSKLCDNVTSIMCPEEGCRGVLDPEYCRLILPDELFDCWETALKTQNEQSSNNPETNEASTSRLLETSEASTSRLLETSEASTSNDPSTSNDASTFTCYICYESFQVGESFNIKGCSHIYCQQCIVSYVSAKLQDNVTSIKCPEPAGCSGELDPEYCHPILPDDIYDWWGKALCEHELTFYCPFADCSAPLFPDDGINMSECPHCKRVVCAKCKVPWHIEFNCDEFQRLRDKGEDEMVRALVKKNKWRQCGNCKCYVEKEEGCNYIKCRCGYAFCYNCGKEKNPDQHTRYCSCEKMVADRNGFAFS